MYTYTIILISLSLYIYIYNIDVYNDILCYNNIYYTLLIIRTNPAGVRHTAGVQLAGG